MKTLDKVIGETIGISEDAKELTPMDKGECRLVAEAWAEEVVKNQTMHHISGGLNFEGLTEMKVFADNTGLIIEIEDAEDTCSKHLNIEETKKLADFLNCR